MVRPSQVTATALLGAIAACGDGPRRVTLEPVPLLEPACGRPAGGLSMIVTALGAGPDVPRSFEPGAPVEIDDFPAGARQLMVEVLGAGGETVALGRSAPIALGALDDGAVIRVLMAPPDRACRVAALGAARGGPTVIAAGDGAIVLGGGPGQPLGTAEWYDAAAGQFAPLELPQAFTGALGVAGAATVALADGRIVLIGGDRPVFAVLDPLQRRFVDDGAIFEIRAHHAAVALDGARVAVAGGCGMLDRTTGACMPGTERRETFVLDVDDGTVVYGPTLAVARTGATLIVEPGLDGAAARVVLIGGVDAAGAPVTDAERYDPSAAPGAGAEVAIAGVGGAAVPLASGSTVVAFAGGAPGAAVIVPGVAVARPLPVGVLAAAGAGLSLEDGSAIWTDGGAGALLRLAPLPGRFTAIGAVEPGWSGPGAARLSDGTVLLAGARSTATPLRRPRCSGRPATGPSPAR